MNRELPLRHGGSVSRLPREGSMAAGPLLLGVRPTEEWSTGRGPWTCLACGHQLSLTAGTIFPGHPDPADAVVPRDLVGDQRQGRHQRGGTSNASLGLGSHRNELRGALPARSPRPEGRSWEQGIRRCAATPLSRAAH
jgi:hypothetical protein